MTELVKYFRDLLYKAKGSRLPTFPCVFLSEKQVFSSALYCIILLGTTLRNTQVSCM